MATSEGGHDRTRLVARMLEHGATQVEMDDLMKQAQVVWQIGVGDLVSETCIHAEELMSSGARSCRSGLDVMARMDGTEGGEDPDLATALKKYVQDTCEAIKQVDNALKEKGPDLASLLFEVPDRSQDEMSWRDPYRTAGRDSPSIADGRRPENPARDEAGLRLPARTAVAGVLRAG